MSRNTTSRLAYTRGAHLNSKRLLVGLVGTLLVVGVVLAFAHKPAKRESSTPAPDKTQLSAHASEVAGATASRLLTKTQGFGTAWNGVADEEALLRQFSSDYKDASAKLSASTSTIADPALRQTAIRDGWAAVDSSTRSKWLDDAKKRFKSEQAAFMSANAGKLFELGRLQYPTRPAEALGESMVGLDTGDNDCDPESRHGFGWTKQDDGTQLLELCRSEASFLYNPVGIKFSIAALDTVLQQFDTLHKGEIDSCMDQLIARQNTSRDALPPEALEEAHQSCLPESRKFLTVQAEGDVLTGKLTKLYVMDSESETVFRELYSSDLVSLGSSPLLWKSPSASGVCRSDSVVGEPCGNAD